MSTSDARIQLWTLNSMKFGVYQKVPQYIKKLVPCIYGMKLHRSVPKSAAIHNKFGTLYLWDEIRGVAKSAAMHKNIGTLLSKMHDFQLDCNVRKGECCVLLYVTIFVTF